ncbi:MAG TPA: 3-dehydroquinate synthase [Ktedonobacteraceae bacterium]|nr:3-dehydroquinate synthase [Ktedonobacteraceae bacterium]
MTETQHFFLIGPSGSGKSAVGRLLAERLNKPFLDSDALVEEQCGQRIPAIFAREGEAYFRDCESRVLLEATRRYDSAVIATGGGIVTRQENRALLRSAGTCIYLSVQPEIALSRLDAQRAEAAARGEDPEIRPLLAGSDPPARLRSLLSDRVQWYEDAHVTFVTDEKSIEQVVQEIIAVLISAGEIASDPHLLAVQRVHSGDGYNVVIDWGGLGRLSANLKMLGLPPRVFLITDQHVGSLYAPTLIGQLLATGFAPELLTIPAGEASKSQQQLNDIYDWLIDRHAERGEAIIALGGGVVGDLAGYAAATYLRGVPLVQVPTSLLAQVDSAIGAKTGINHARGKNLIGAFYHPRLVLVDPATLLTLPARERTEGWAEVVKYGMILDANLFTRLEAEADELRRFAHPSAQLLCQIIGRCIELKLSVIEQDEREQGLRALLNYGHTVGHALESVSGYGALLHGEAVSLGMVVAATIAVQAGMFSKAAMARQNKLLKALGLPVVYDGSARATAILAAMQHDKKVTNKQVRWVMPRRIGAAETAVLPSELAESVIATFFDEG